MIKITAYRCNIQPEYKNDSLLNQVEIIHNLNSDTVYSNEVLIWNNNFDFTISHLKQFPKLKHFINWGVDDGNIKTNQEFVDNGISVKKVDYYSTETLSEYVLVLILNFERKLNLLISDQKIVGNEIFGKKLGIIGLGKIGFRVAQIFNKSFNSEVYYYSRKDKFLKSYKYTSIKKIFEICDYVVISVKSSNFSIKFSDLKSANKNLVIVNISNDSVLPVKKIIHMAKTKKIRGFIGDMFNISIEKNQLPKDFMLVNHYGYLSHEATRIKHNILNSYLKKIGLKNSSKDIYLLRHGQTEWNEKGIFQGGLDSPLTISGIESAKKIAKLLKNKQIKNVYTSPLGRAKKTAELIAEELNGKLIVVPDFKEMNFGVFEGKKQKLMKTIFKDFFDQRSSNKFYKLYEPYPEGESYFSVFLRVVRNLTEILPIDQNCIIVGHESINRIIRGIIRELPLEDMVNLKQKNNEIVCINFQTLKETITKVD